VSVAGAHIPVTNRDDQKAAIDEMRISVGVKELLLRSFSIDELRHAVACLEARNHVPSLLAAELANELAEIFSTPPMATSEGLTFNRPTVGWWRRRGDRIAQARST